MYLNPIPSIRHKLFIRTKVGLRATIDGIQVIENPKSAPSLVHNVATLQVFIQNGIKITRLLKAKKDSTPIK